MSKKSWTPDFAQYTRNPHLALAALASIAAIAYYVYFTAKGVANKDKDEFVQDQPRPKAPGQQDEAQPELYGDRQQPLVAYVPGAVQGYDFYDKAKYPKPQDDRARMRTNQSNGFPVYAE